MFKFRMLTGCFHRLTGCAHRLTGCCYRLTACLLRLTGHIRLSNAEWVPSQADGMCSQADWMLSQADWMFSQADWMFSQALMAYLAANRSGSAAALQPPGKPQAQQAQQAGLHQLQPDMLLHVKQLYSAFQSIVRVTQQVHINQPTDSCFLPLSLITESQPPVIGRSTYTEHEVFDSV